MNPSTDPARFKPPAAPFADALGEMRSRMQRSGQWQSHQMAGRRWPVACVSLEITQRCNLDCTLCYLSELSEAVRDFPLEEVFRRIDMIVEHYGAGTDVQVSGGEPTLRRRDELVAIVRRLASRIVARDLSTHRLGSREFDLAVWLGSRLVVPSQNGMRLRVLDASSGWGETDSAALPARLAMTAALPDARGLAALLDDGSVTSFGMR